MLIVNGHSSNIAAFDTLTTELNLGVDLPIAIRQLYALFHKAGADVDVLDDQQSIQQACGVKIPTKQSMVVIILQCS